MRTKTVYLHENGNLVIWGLSAFFEPSHLVKRQFRIAEETADSEDFRIIIALYNDNVKEINEAIKANESLIKELDEYFTKKVEYGLMLEKIKRLSFWKRLFKKNILNIIGE